MFVTWKITESSSLRGCIGTFTPVPLWEGLAKYAVESALNDNRFSSIQFSEVPLLTVCISLLGDFEECLRWDDWEIGKHGIRILYNSRYSATFLPEVAKEQQWTKRQTIDALLEKGGYNDKTWNENLLKVTRYKSKKHSMTYAEYADLNNLESLQ